MEEQTIEIIELARQMVELIADKKGEDIVLMDLGEETIIADYFIICSGSSERQIKAIANEIKNEIKKVYGLNSRFIEGAASTGWVIIDYSDIVIHVFSHDIREYYDLETFWIEHGASVLLKMQ